MSASINDGGPAFPCENYVLKNGKQVTEAAQGMSLRDYFAGQALAALISLPDSKGSSAQFAQAAYEYADAMLAARKEASK